MKESFLQFYKCRLKRTIKSVQTWIKVVSILIAYIILFIQIGTTSVTAYICNISMIVAVFVLVDLIFAFIAWFAKNNKIKNSEK